MNSSRREALFSLFLQGGGFIRERDERSLEWLRLNQPPLGHYPSATNAANPFRLATLIGPWKRLMRIPASRQRSAARSFTSVAGTLGMAPTNLRLRPLARGRLDLLDRRFDWSRRSLPGRNERV